MSDHTVLMDSYFFTNQWRGKNINKNVLLSLTEPNLCYRRDPTSTYITTCSTILSKLCEYCSLLRTCPSPEWHWRSATSTLDEIWQCPWPDQTRCPCAVFSRGLHRPSPHCNTSYINAYTPAPAFPHLDLLQEYSSWYMDTLYICNVHSTPSACPEYLTHMKIYCTVHTYMSIMPS